MADEGYEARMKQVEERLRVAEEEARKQKEEARKQSDKNRALEEEIRILSLKTSFTYWSTFDQIWDFDLTAYEGLYEQTLSLRQKNAPQIYNTVHHLLMDGCGIETVLDKNNVFSLTTQTESIVTMESNEMARVDAGNRATREANEKKHLKNFLGFLKGEGEISKAHGFPNDGDCNLYWWPILRMVTGTHSADLNKSALDKMAAMKTNKIAFPGPHNHFYDNLTKGVVCTIPIFESMEAMATTWDYKQGYQMLIVCDSVNAYLELKMPDDAHFPHISVASPEDVTNATTLVAEMTKVLADSLVSNWDGHYKDLDDVGRRKEMLKMMKDILTNDNQNRVHIPIIKQPTLEEIKLYKIDYKILYVNDSEGQKFIHDPFPALIKSAVNLSAFVNKKLQRVKKKQGCKLLPACACLQDHDLVSDGVSSEPDILDLLDRSGYLRNRPVSEFPSLVGYCSHEISSAVVSDDELEGDQHPNDDAVGDDIKSVISDLTA
mmetsp:Transcript_5632/g.8164  ORF Transcript_5632/g.8164 Transcript_5632/m.8164 type:complete len:491 (-) Transcript_5632:815-2287(-)